MDIWKSNDGHYFGHNCPTICLGITGEQGSTLSLERKIQWQLWIGIFLLVNKKASLIFHWNFLHFFKILDLHEMYHLTGKSFCYLTYILKSRPTYVKPFSYTCTFQTGINWTFETVHYRLRFIESGHYRFLDFASHFICLQIFQIGFSTERLTLSASKHSRYIFSGRNAQFSIGRGR